MTDGKLPDKKQPAGKRPAGKRPEPTAAEVKPPAAEQPEVTQPAAEEHAETLPAKAPFSGSDEDRLVAEMLAPPPLEQAQESVDFWRRRRSELPLYRRGARREAERRLAEAEAQLRASRRSKFGPTLLEQLSEAVGLTISPARIRRLLALTAVSVVLVVVGFVVAAVAFWPQIEPIVRFFIGGGGGGGEGGGG